MTGEQRLQLRERVSGGLRLGEEDDGVERRALERGRIVEGDDPETRLRKSFEDVRSKRQAELAGRALEIDPAEAVRDLMPLAQNYLASEVFQRVSAAHRIDGESDNSQFAIRNPQSGPGLWSELRFRLRRPLGILTGTIDKLLITPSANGEGFDVEIIDFKTNRFRSPAQMGAKQTQTAAAAVTSLPVRLAPRLALTPRAEIGEIAAIAGSTGR